MQDACETIHRIRINWMILIYAQGMFPISFPAKHTNSILEWLLQLTIFQFSHSTVVFPINYVNLISEMIRCDLFFQIWAVMFDLFTFHSKMVFLCFLSLTCHWPSCHVKKKMMTLHMWIEEWINQNCATILAAKRKFNCSNKSLLKVIAKKWKKCHASGENLKTCLFLEWKQKVLIIIFFIFFYLFNAINFPGISGHRSP